MVAETLQNLLIRTPSVARLYFHGDTLLPMHRARKRERENERERELNLKICCWQLKNSEDDNNNDNI